MDKISFNPRLNMEDYIISSKFKNIAKGNIAFCILGGPSTSQVKNLPEIIKNNFTVTVNHSITKYPNSDLYLTSDNITAREYFEENQFFFHKFKGGKFVKTASNFDYDDEPIWREGKKHIILQNPNLIKILGCTHFPCYNHIFTTGQLYKYYGVEYCKKTSNTHLCMLHKDNNNDANPMLSLNLPETVESYGSDMNKIILGGNVASILLQILWYMGFDKVITVGFGDKGKSTGYSVNSNKFNDTFVWSNEELHGLMVHNRVWGKNLKTLHGGEIFRDYCDFPQADYNEFESTPNKKNKLIKKLISI